MTDLKIELSSIDRNISMRHGTQATQNYRDKRCVKHGARLTGGKKQNNEGSHEVTRHPGNLLFVKSFTCFFFTGKMDTRRGIVGTLKMQSWDQRKTSFPPKNQNKTKSQGFESWGTFQLCKFWFCHHSKTNLCAITALKLEKLVFCFAFFLRKKKRAATSASRTIFHFTADNPQSWQWAVFTETNFPSINSLDEKTQPEEKGSTHFILKLLWTPRG